MPKFERLIFRIKRHSEDKNAIAFVSEKTLPRAIIGLIQASLSAIDLIFDEKAENREIVSLPKNGDNLFEKRNLRF